MSKSVLDGIKIPGYTNRWSSIDEYKLGEKTYYLMENDTWGDETCLLVITPDFKEIYETYDDIETCLTDEGILKECVSKSNLKEKYVDVEAFENKELAQAFEDVEKELDDINKVLDTLYKTPEKYISIKSLKEASGHLYDAWKSLHNASGKKDIDDFNENLIKKEKISPKILEKDEDAYKKLDAVAKSLTKKSPNGYTYYVDDTYLDFGSNYKWTTIIADAGIKSSTLNHFEDSYQALSPKEWEDIVNGDKAADEMADEILADEFCPDKLIENDLKSAIHDLRRM